MLSKGWGLYREAIKDVTGVCFETLCRALLSLLLLVILAGMGYGVARAAFGLFAAAGHMLTGSGLHEALRELVVNVLVVVITKIMGFWFREVEVERVGLAIALVVALLAVRIMAVRFSPKQRDLLEGL